MFATYRTSIAHVVHISVTVTAKVDTGCHPCKRPTRVIPQPALLCFVREQGLK